MFTEIELAPEIHDFLTNLPVPVRVLDGRAGELKPPAWRARQVGAPLRECVETGLTLVSWGSDHDPANGGGAASFMYVNCMPGAFYADGARRALSREFIADHRRDTRSYIPYDHTFARYDVERRIVWFNFPLTPHASGGLDLTQVDLYKILGEPIERVLGAEKLPRCTERAREMFLEAATRERGHPRLERAIDQQRQNIASHAELIRVGHVELRRLQSELAVQRHVTTVCRARLEERWEALLAHPMLSRIRDNGSALVLTTAPLDMENPNTGETNYLGVIDIRLEHTTHALALTLTNVDNAKDERAHPHCPQHGVPCWGGAESHASQLLASHDLPAIFEFALQYLQSYNPGDVWGSYASLWGFGTDDEGDEDDGECQCPDCIAEREGAAA